LDTRQNYSLKGAVWWSRPPGKESRSYIHDSLATLNCLNLRASEPPEFGFLDSETWFCARRLLPGLMFLDYEQSLS
jgi:hypothetical protein